jgi:NTP pyrophosphatase (non-canonical NTP hydrolase)
MNSELGLTFRQLREANMARLPQFKNSKGEWAHSPEITDENERAIFVTGQDWTPAQWVQAVLGELGEYANIRKKFERGDISQTEFLTAAGKELADTVTYLDILATQLGINLGEATRIKFNEVSRRVGCEVFL